MKKARRRAMLSGSEGSVGAKHLWQAPLRMSLGYVMLSEDTVGEPIDPADRQREP